MPVCKILFNRSKLSHSVSWFSINSGKIGRTGMSVVACNPINLPHTTPKHQRIVFVSKIICPKTRTFYNISFQFYNNFVLFILT